MTKTGKGLDEMTWSALDAFITHSGADSALMAELNPELSEWSSRTKTNAILADIFDMLAMINANLMAVGARKPAKRPKLYPRPGTKDPETKRHFGKGALPADELREWFERKRAELCQK